MTRPDPLDKDRIRVRVPRDAAVAAVVAIAIVVAALGGGVRNLLSPDGTASPLASVLTVTPAATGEPPLSTAACDLVDPNASAPAFRLTAQGTTGATSARLGRVQGAVVNTSPEVWLVPAEAPALRVEPGADLQLRVADGRCIARIAAEYAPAVRGTPEAGERIAFRTTGFEPPNAAVTFRPLPEGDWVVHVIAHPFTATDLGENTAYVELFFRVISGRHVT